LRRRWRGEITGDIRNDVCGRDYLDMSALSEHIVREHGWNWQLLTPTWKL